MATVHYESRGPVGLITLDRPPVNAISVEVVEDLEAAVAEAESPSIRSAVVTGEPHFAAGADIATFQEAFDSGTPHEPGLALSKVIRRFEQLAKPTIAAVQGYALGGGLELAMGADFIYLAEDAQVGQPEVKLGIIPGAGGTQRLPRLVGLAKARDMIYTGRFVGAQEAADIGLATKVVASAELFKTALEDAAELAAGPTTAIAAAKRAMNESASIEAGLALEAEAFAASFATRDAREGVAAFLEKRSATFEGS